MGAPRSAVRFIEAVQELVPVAGRLEQRWLPDGRTRLVLRVHADGRGDLCVAGPRTRAMFKQPHVARAVVVQLGAGHTAQLGVGAHELTDRIDVLANVSYDDGIAAGISLDRSATRQASS